MFFFAFDPEMGPCCPFRYETANGPVSLPSRARIFHWDRAGSGPLDRTLAWVWFQLGPGYFNLGKPKVMIDKTALS